MGGAGASPERPAPVAAGRPRVARAVSGACGGRRQGHLLVWARLARCCRRRLPPLRRAAVGDGLPRASGSCRGRSRFVGALCGSCRAACCRRAAYRPVAGARVGGGRECSSGLQRFSLPVRAPWRRRFGRRASRICAVGFCVRGSRRRLLAAGTCGGSRHPGLSLRRSGRRGHLGRPVRGGRRVRPPRVVPHGNCCRQAAVGVRLFPCCRAARLRGCAGCARSWLLARRGAAGRAGAGASRRTRRDRS